MSCEKEFLLIPEDYCNYYGISEAPKNFEYLLRKSIDTLNFSLGYNNNIQRQINLNTKKLLEWSYIKKAICEQIKFIIDNPSSFGMVGNSERPAIAKIGRVTFNTKTENVKTNSNSRYGNISSEAYHYLDTIGWLYRGIC